MYQQRLTVFIDLLGFRKIVEKTETDDKFTNSIYEVLNSIKTENINLEVFGHVNKEIINPNELEEVLNFNKELSEHLKKNSTVQVTHFSDSIVLSANISDETSTFSILELLAKLNFRLWNEYKLLLRGGISIGKLVHEEHGALFGPAMVRAYDLESQLASNPRIIIDDECSNYIRKSDLYKIMKRLFSDYNGKKLSDSGDILLEVKDGLEINLATSFDHIFNSALSMHPKIRKTYISVFNNTLSELEKIKTDSSNSKIISKYDYVVSKIGEVKAPSL